MTVLQVTEAVGLKGPILLLVVLNLVNTKILSNSFQMKQMIINPVSFLGEEGSGTAPNGNISPRKGYTRAPFDDWRKPTSNSGGNGEEQEEVPIGSGGGGPPNSGSAGGGWRTGPSTSGRR